MKIRLISTDKGIVVTDAMNKPLENVVGVSIRYNSKKNKLVATVAIENPDLDIEADVNTKIWRKNG